MKKKIRVIIDFICATRIRKLVTAAVFVLVLCITIGLIIQCNERNRRSEGLMNRLNSLRERQDNELSQQDSYYTYNSSEDSESSMSQLQLATDATPDYGTIPSFGTYYYASQDGSTVAYVNMNTNVISDLRGGTIENHTICVISKGAVTYSYLANVNDFYDYDDHWTAFPGWDSGSGITISIDKGWNAISFGGSIGSAELPVRITGYQYEELVNGMSAPPATYSSDTYNQSEDNSEDDHYTYQQRTPKSHYIPCPSCTDGKCSSCNGIGQKTYSVWDADLGRYSYQLDKCPVCNGSGTCGTCRGYGQIVNY